MSTNEGSTNGSPEPQDDELAADSLESVSGGGGGLGDPLIIRLPYPIESPPWSPLPIHTLPFEPTPIIDTTGDLL